VEVLLKTRVKACTRNQIHLSIGAEIDAHTFVWAAGTAPSPVLDLVSVPRGKSGRVEADATMAVKERPGVWAVGDSANIPDIVTGGTCPPTAQYALRQGRRLADNIAAAIRGEEPKPFRFKALGLLAGLGRRSAVAEIFGLRFSGFIAWWLWRTIYLLKLPGFERKLRVAIDWTLDLFFARDIVYLRPLHVARGPAAVSHPIPDDSRSACDADGQGEVCQAPLPHLQPTSRQLEGVH
jgi:NADH dehydrogenase